MSYVFGRRPQGIETRNDGAMIPYRLSGEWDAETARAYAIASTPRTFGVWFRKDLRMTGQGGGIWDIDVEYSTPEKQEPQAGAYKWAFDTTGQTKKVTQAITHVATYAAPGRSAIDHHGAIGVTDDSVEGVDVPDRAFKWPETWQLPLGSYGFFYSTILGELTGRVNNTYFRGFPAYTVRFDGATGGPSQQDPTLLEITFNFSVSPSETDLVVGDITGINKLGWDYLWVRYESTDDDTAKKTTPKPIQVEVDRVLTSFNFALLGIGTGILT
jgi:hypothetical protein